MDGAAATLLGIRFEYTIGPLGNVDGALLEIQQATEVDRDLEGGEVCE